MKLTVRQYWRMLHRSSKAKLMIIITIMLVLEFAMNGWVGLTIGVVFFAVALPFLLWLQARDLNRDPDFQMHLMMHREYIDLDADKVVATPGSDATGLMWWLTMTYGPTFVHLCEDGEWHAHIGGPEFYWTGTTPLAALQAARDELADRA